MTKPFEPSMSAFFEHGDVSCGLLRRWIKENHRKLSVPNRKHLKRCRMAARAVGLSIPGIPAYRLCWTEHTA